MSQKQKIENAITDLIDNVERFFSVAPLQFLDIEGGNDDIGCFTFINEYKTHFGQFPPWFQHFLETVDPFYGQDEERAKAADKIIKAVLPEDDKVKRAWCELHDSLSSLVYPAQRVGFFVGVLVGAKIQGASHGDLVEIGKGLVRPSLSRWEVAKSNAA